MSSRRTFLRSGSGVLATGLLGGVAGCVGLDDLLGGSDDPATDWVVDPLVLDANHVSFTSIALSSVADHAQHLRTEDWEAMQRSVLDAYDFVRFLPDEVDRYDRVRSRGGSGAYEVFAADVDGDRIARNLRDREYFSRGEYEEFEVYLDDGEDRAVAFDDTHLVVTDTDRDPYRMVQDVLDTATGNRDGFREVDEDFDTLVGELPSGDQVVAFTRERPEETNAETGTFRNNVASGFSTDVTGEETEMRLVLVFLDNSDVVEGDVDTWIGTDSTFDTIRDVDVETDGRTATVTGTIRTRDYGETL
ncbi:hypothetical protein BRD00_14395 [Halobacteriales archaeon QS_8_69_26]|nr:MAG: hypothetical protein BRD00_14395 [Halobacteriales archaeon QS_8_69_26]